MPRIGRPLIILLFLAMFSMTVSANCLANGYRGFKLLNPDECTPLDKKTVMQLPEEWHKYSDCIKICELKRKKSTNARVSIISIWAHDYYKKLPADAPWERFPRPLIVDDRIRKIGELPKLYPFDQPCDLDVYYGRWRSGMPGEIRIDVLNPAVEGDFYYEPLIWNEKTGSYEMKSKEAKYGRRPGK